MPSVFTDEVGTYDLTITTAADWTVSAGGLPNGDNYVTGDGSIAPTYNTSGSTFDIRTGNWTIEFWLYFDATSLDRMIITNAKAGSAVASEWAWGIYLSTVEQLVFFIGNTAAGNYGLRISATLLGTTWYYVVAQKISGTAAPVIYVNEVASSSSSSGPTGTAVTPDGTYRLYLGTDSAGNEDVTSGLRLAKVAIYNRLLDSTEMAQHRLAMISA